MTHDQVQRHKRPSHTTRPRFMSSICVPRCHALLFVALGAAFPIWAQQPPDAGRILQEQQTAPLVRPQAKPSLELTSPSTAPRPSAGGPKVTIQEFVFSGNSQFDSVTLRAVIGDVAGHPFDFAGLRTLSDRISSFYRQEGYPFARAFLPSQAVTDGQLHIAIVEGRYGKVAAVGDAALASSAQPFLSALHSGDVIKSLPLERAISILGDQPGILIVSTIRPGQDVGTGDLDVRVERGRTFRGEVGYDNHGNRYTGEHRVRSNIQWDSPFTFGDQITASVMYSDEGLWLGNIGYSLPLLSSGLRGSVGYSQTSYKLAKDFSNLDASGSAEITSAGLTYPILRSQNGNLTIGATFQHKRLKDRRGAFVTDDEKSSNVLPVALQFDSRDALFGGGVTYGSFGITSGYINLGATLENADALSGHDTRGGFNKLNLNVARVQATPIEGLTIFGRVSAQGADKNLDSSEKFSLGGPNGVRAYPVDEAIGDEGWLAQIELRHAMKFLSPYLFYDFGNVQVNARKEKIIPVVAINSRQIAGAGIGVRHTARALNVDLSVAWRTQGGMPQADTSKRDPRLWVNIGYQF